MGRSRKNRRADQPAPLAGYRAVKRVGGFVVIGQVVSFAAGDFARQATSKVSGPRRSINARPVQGDRVAML